MVWGDDPELAPMEHLHSMQGIPPDAQLMGLDRNTQEGALVALAGSLSSRKRTHRVVAWLMLVAFVAPLLSASMHQLF
jgi:hypothetical protein